MTNLQSISTSKTFYWLGRYIHRLPTKQRQRYARWLGKILLLLSSSRARTTLDNIRQAFPERSAEWHRALQRACYDNLALTLLEVMMFPHLTPSETRAMVEFKNLHLIEDEYQHKRGIVLLSGHFGNWELVAFALPLVVDLPISVVVTEQTNTYLNDLLRWYRTRTGNTLIRMDNAARRIISTLKRGEAIAMLADQAATPETDVFVPFFGRLACTYEAPAVLSLRYNAPLIVGFAERMSNGRYVVELQKIPHEDLRADAEGIYNLTCRHVAALEKVIRKRPELWSWQHKRWKHTPPNSSEKNTTTQDIPSAQQPQQYSMLTPSADNLGHSFSHAPMLPTTLSSSPSHDLHPHSRHDDYHTQHTPQQTSRQQTQQHTEHRTTECH